MAPGNTMSTMIKSYGRKRAVLIFILGIIFNTAISQSKQTQRLEQLWLGYFNQTRIAGKWGTWTDLHLRTKEDFVTNFSQSIIRLGLTYYLNDATKLTAGYAYVSIYPADNHKNITQPEHRPWQQVQWHTKYARVRTMQWLRLEERFRRKILSPSELASGYSFNYRVRYNFFLQVPLSKKGVQPKTASFVVNDEVHVNFGNQVVYNYFDQNRFFVGISCQTSKSDNLQLGYMNLFQQLGAGNQYKSINAARIFYFHNLDLRRK